ncbi:unnamed protein product [Bursaphelenchus xylophilus]|uniref:(pine wood nematode) hypothetical protein n=1 Tax=Bursaphelenchus xylophilus TaxID=6326 RepID=A0A1I7RJ42_BURXY|nr:unnamed protein product [Bursaphelenchus xylophilus]CAG9119334.1 unnamed protein product [Bursaphelenchus xylophilus]
MVSTTEVGDEEQEACKVCGDKPIGFNFGVVSCDSCRSFFRRCNGAEKTLKCPFQRNCVINKESRRCCQACRLQKCYSVGMFYEENARKRPYRKSSGKSSVALKSPKKSPLTPVEMPVSPPKHCLCRCQCGFYPSDARLVAVSDVGKGHGAAEVACSKEFLMVDQQLLVNANSPMGHVPSSIDFPPQLPGTSFQTVDIPKPHIQTPCYSSDLRKTLELKYQPVEAEASILGLPQNYPSVIQNSPYFSALPQIYANAAWPYQGSDLQPTFSYPSPAIPPSNLLEIIEAENALNDVALDDENRSLMDELIDANGILKAPMELSIQELENPNELSLMTVVKISDLAMRRIIAMVKKLRLFRDIEHADQIALLKGGLSELLILRGVMVFDPHKNAWIHHIHSGSQEISLRVDVLKKSPEEEHYRAHTRFLTSFDEEWRTNEPVMLILNGIILFSPDRPNLRNPQAVTRTRERYHNLLRNYLRNYCSNDAASLDAYTKLTVKLDELKELNRSLQRIYSRLNPDDLEPLLKELFASTA